MTDEEEISKGLGSVVKRNEDIMVKVGDPRASMFRAIMDEYGGLDEYFKEYIGDAKEGDRDRDHSLQRQLMDKVVPSLQAQALIVNEKTMGKGEEMRRLRDIFGGGIKSEEEEDKS